MTASHQILVLGATGPTGRHIVVQGLDQGHTITALARRPERLDVRNARLSTITADLAADVEALPGHDVVISALGRGQALRSHGLMARVTPRIVSAMEGQGGRRLLFHSAYGVGDTAPHAPWSFRLMIPLMLADIFADKAIAEEAVRHSALDWTILAPVMLTNGPATGRYRLGEQLEIRGFARMARTDVASAVLACIDDSNSVRKRYIVSS